MPPLDFDVLAGPDVVGRIDEGTEDPRLVGDSTLLLVGGVVNRKAPVRFVRPAGASTSSSRAAGGARGLCAGWLVFERLHEPVSL
jgi:hypothetical protein